MRLLGFGSNYSSRAKCSQLWFPDPLQTVLSYGGLSNIRYPRLHETLVSGANWWYPGSAVYCSIDGANNVMVTDWRNQALILVPLPPQRTR